MRAQMAAGRGSAPSSGNRAFDEYRSETLRRLEEEQREFREFLDRLRFAKDKTEFDQFMAERRNRPEPESPPAAELNIRRLRSDRPSRWPRRAAFVRARRPERPLAVMRAERSVTSP